MVLPHAVHPSATQIDAQIRIPHPPASVRRDGRRHRTAGHGQGPQPLVRQVDEDHQVPRDRVRATAVFVHLRANIERRRKQIHPIPHQDHPSTLGTPALQPVQVTPLESGLVKDYPITRQARSADRRGPRPIRCDNAGPSHAGQSAIGPSHRPKLGLHPDHQTARPPPGQSRE